MRPGLEKARCMEDSDHDEFTNSLSPPTFVHEVFSAERTGLGSVRPSKDFHHNRKKGQSRFLQLTHVTWRGAMKRDDSRA